MACNIPFTCHACKRNFYNGVNYKEHTETAHVTLAYACSVCNKEFGRIDNMKRHEEKFNNHQVSRISSGAATKRPLTK